MGVNGIYGLSGSGLDVESMVKVGMMSKKNEYEKMQQKFTQNEWKKAEYLELYGEVQTFNNSTLSQYKLSSNMNARSAASSNESAVTATATANAAPMQHYVEVGQLATSAYLIGTESVERVGEESDSNSTALVDSLFKSLTKNLNGTYSYTDSNGTTVSNLNSDDVAFTFNIGDGTTSKNYLSSTNENVFSARVLTDATDEQKATSHTVEVGSIATPATITSASGNSVNNSMKTFFRNLFKASEESDENFDLRINRLATGTMSNTTAFSITVFENDENDASATTVNFTYAELAGSQSFLENLQSKLTGNIRASANSSGQLLLENRVAGADKNVKFSIDTNSFALGGTDPNNLSIPPRIDSGNIKGLTLTASTTPLQAFTQILSGGSDTAVFQRSLELYKSMPGSDTAAVTLNFTYTSTGNTNPTTKAVNFTYADIAGESPATFLGKVKKAFDDNDNIEVTINNSGQLRIYDKTYGTSSQLNFSIADTDVKIGSTYDISHDNTQDNRTIRTVASMTSKTIAGLDENSTTPELFSKILGFSSTDAYKNAISAVTAATDTTAVTLQFSDHIDNSTPPEPVYQNITFTYGDLKATDTTISSFINTLNNKFSTANLKLQAEYITDDSGGSIKLSHTESEMAATDVDDTANISFKLDANAFDFASNTNILKTNPEPVQSVPIQELTTSTKISALMHAAYSSTGMSVTSIQTFMSSNSISSDTTAFGFNFKDSTNGTEKTVDFSFGLLTDENKAVQDLLDHINEALSTTNIQAVYQEAAGGGTLAFVNNNVGSDTNIEISIGVNNVYGSTTNNARAVLPIASFLLGIDLSGANSGNVTNVNLPGTVTLDGNNSHGSPTIVYTLKGTNGDAETIQKNLTNGLSSVFSGTTSTSSITINNNANNNSPTQTTINAVSYLSEAKPGSLDGATNSDIAKNIADFFNVTTNNSSYTLNKTGDNGGSDVYSGAYTSTNLADKLADFLAGSDISSTDSKYTYTSSSGANGSVVIDGKEITLDATNNNALLQDGIYYTFHTAGGGMANIINSTETISVTYEQLANGYSYNDLISNINNLGLNIRASYDSVQDRFSIYNKKSGSENEIRIGFDNLIDTTYLVGSDVTDAENTNAAVTRTAAFFDSLGLRQTENGILDKTTGSGADKTDIDFEFAVGKTSILAGKNAVAKIDGVDYYELDSNNVTVNGVNYTFNAVTNSIADNYDTTTDKTGATVKVVKSDSSTPKVTVNITQDTASIAEKVKSFVEDYNTMLAKLYEWYDEKPNENYKPLTASQKEGMKEEQIEKWEEKAKAGLLYHDQTLYKVISDMRSAITERVQGIDSDYNTIFALGISTTGTKGQLKLDETKLNAALAADPDAVYNIFAKLDGGETQYLVEVNGTGTEIWSADPTYGRAVLDDEGNQQTKVENGVKLYLVEVKRKQIWTTNTSLGTIVTDSDGNPMTKTDERYSHNGIANRLGTILNNGLKNLRTVAGSSSGIDEDSDLNNLLRELQTKMSNFKRLMDAFESKLYKKYDAMESSLALLGAQLNYVTGAFQ